ncbi:ATP-binding protein [Vibrio parahaemolyticus]|nr:ATP-binding protein [Vibrio parahaemolyticus]EIV1597916.1 ATP-binding protein [Vibrio parahaemolyticus]EMC2461148.1 ATP-binding protein [Vibrio alginolyticus]
MAIELNKVTAINVPELANHDFELVDARPSTLENIRQINVIIGPNSSGKSRFIRTIFSNAITAFDLGLGLYKTAIDELNVSEPDFPSVYTAVNSLLSLRKKALLDSNLIEALRNVIENELHNIRSGSVNHSDTTEIIGKFFSTDFQNKMTDAHASIDFDMQSTRKEYIPILRGLRTLVPTNDVYLERTLQDYFGGLSSGSTLNIFTGHTLYEDMVYALLGIEEEQESVKKYQDYLSMHFFEGQRVNIIPRKDRDDKKSSKENNVVHIKIGDEPQRPIYELGDGIQAMIALTVRPFLEKEPTIFFIEEPEQNLHAGMQRALIEAFRACPQHMFFFTTQSNHFVDLTLEADDLNLISVKKTVDQDGKATSIVQSQANNNEVLKDLGVLASSVLLANCSIWVEGVTDKRYLQVYLAKYLDELETFSNSEDGTLAECEAAKARVAKLRTYNENLHYVFVEYQGSNITHWAFTDEADPEETSQTPAQKLSKDILLIADADIDSKGRRVEDLKEALGDRFELLKWKEIENYIPQHIIIKAAKKHWDSFQKTQGSIYDFEDLADEYFENSEIGIGGLLEDKVSRSSTATKSPNSYFYRDGPPTKKVGDQVVDSPSSGSTIRIKVAFCDTVVNIMKGKNDDNQIDWQLTPELKDLCNRIWLFIEECN